MHSIATRLQLLSNGQTWENMPARSPSHDKYTGLLPSRSISLHHTPTPNKTVLNHTPAAHSGSLRFTQVHTTFWAGNHGDYDETSRLSKTKIIAKDGNSDFVTILITMHRLPQA
jgi:hypothetical protein